MAIAPILVAVCAGLIFGFLRRGRLAAIARTRIRHPEFLAVALGASLFIDISDAGPSGTIAIVGLIGGLAFAVVNLHLAGMTIITLGIVANLIPIAVNGTMPVRPEALVEAEMVTVDELPRVSLSGARELSDDATRLAFLGDTFPVRWTGQVVSIGDLIMMVGLADVVSNLMIRRRRRRLHPSALPALEALGWHEDPDLVTDTGVVTIDLRDDIDLRDQVVISLVDEDQAESAPPS